MKTIQEQKSAVLRGDYLKSNSVLKKRSLGQTGASDASAIEVLREQMAQQHQEVLKALALKNTSDQNDSEKKDATDSPKAKQDWFLPDPRNKKAPKKANLALGEEDIKSSAPDVKSFHSGMRQAYKVIKGVEDDFTSLKGFPTHDGRTFDAHYRVNLVEAFKKEEEDRINQDAKNALKKFLPDLVQCQIAYNDADNVAGGQARKKLFGQLEFVKGDGNVMQNLTPAAAGDNAGAVQNDNNITMKKDLGSHEFELRVRYAGGGGADGTGPMKYRFPSKIADSSVSARDLIDELFVPVGAPDQQGVGKIKLRHNIEPLPTDTLTLDEAELSQFAAKKWNGSQTFLSDKLKQASDDTKKAAFEKTLACLYNDHTSTQFSKLCNSAAKLAALDVRKRNGNDPSIPDTEKEKISYGFDAIIGCGQEGAKNILPGAVLNLCLGALEENIDSLAKENSGIFGGA